METLQEITGYKKGQLLYFERNNKTIVFDFADMEFKRPLKNGTFKPLVGGQAFFRKLSVSDVANGFLNRPYAELMRKVSAAVSGRVTNFASVFENLPKYKHLESHLVLGIKFSRTNVFKNPVSIWTKDAIAFMKESGITFDDYRWENNYLENKYLVSKLITHVRKNHYLDLEVYRMLYNLVRNYNLSKFTHLTDPQATTPTFETNYWGNGLETRIAQTPFGCEYKTLFDYLVMIERTEACNFETALTLYYDYLKMMRDMERSKAIGIMRESNPDLDERTVGYVGFGRIEKYPKYLRTRHDIVQKNYRAYMDSCDEKKFASCVEKGYEYSWGSYKIVVPKKSEDVKNEGTSLHHCVASYVSRILDKTTQIVFMREDENESLVTVEIRAGAIVQARGYNNRSVDANEKKWLKTFAKAKNLSYEDVKRNETMPTPPVTALVRWDSHIALLRELSQL